MSYLSLWLLGPVQILIDGQPAGNGLWSKGQALLAYLAMESDQSHRRDMLAGLLWPEKPNETALINLRQLLHQCQKVIPCLSQVLKITPTSLHWTHSEYAWTDSFEFNQILQTNAQHDHTSLLTCRPCLDRLNSAAALYRGDFLEDLKFSGSQLFEDWALLKREDYRRRFVSTLSDLTEIYLSVQAYDLAEQAARKQICLDPYREIAHRQIMRILNHSGQRHAAIKYYEQLAILLETDLGVQPETETRVLSERISQEDDFIEYHSPIEMWQINDQVLNQSHSSGYRPPFVGRKQELEQLRRKFIKAQNGSGQFVFITGEAGWGKTALFEAFAQQIQKDHPDVIVSIGRGNAYTGIGDPYLPFREILEYLSGDIEAQWSARAISQDAAYRILHLIPETVQAILEAGPDLVGTFLLGKALMNRASAYHASEELNRGSAWFGALRQLVRQKLSSSIGSPLVLQKNLFEQYTRVLLTLSRSHTLILFLDDLQWMDMGSSSLLFHLGKHISNSHILLVGAFRPSEMPHIHVINELKRDQGTIELSLAEDEKGFVDALIDVEPNRLGYAFRKTLYHLTHGQALFSVELMQNLKARGSLVKAPDGFWVEGETLEWDILPKRVEAVIAEKLRCLPKKLRDMMTVACVEGEVFTASVVASTLNLDEGEVVNCLSHDLGNLHHLVQAESIRWIGEQRLFQYRFDHILFQKYLYNTLDPIQRARLHGEVGCALEKLFGEASTENAVILAWHFQEAGVIWKAIHYLRLAGENAVQFSANQEAIRQFVQAIELLKTLPETPERAKQELDLQTNLGASYLMLYGFTDARVGETYVRAYALCRQVGEISQLFLIIWQLALHYEGKADLAHGDAMLQELIDLGKQAQDPLLTALGHWLMGWHDLYAGKLQASRAYLDDMITFYNPAKHQHLAALYTQDPGVGSLAIQGLTLVLLGYPEQALRVGQSAIELARQIDQPYSLAFALAYKGIVAGLCQNSDELRATAEECIQVTQKYGFLYWLSAGLFCRGWALIQTDFTETGLKDINQAIDLVKDMGVKVAQDFIIKVWAEGLVKVSQAEKGLILLDQRLQMAEQTGEAFFVPELLRVKGEALISLSGTNAQEAEANFNKSLELAQQQEALLWKLKTTMSLARLWIKNGKTHQARQRLLAVYSQFSEGVETGLLNEAQTLIESVS
jgi:DNA-binding SARP family transcriptional activator/predicted ATPase